MAFTGKSTRQTTPLPKSAEDLSDIIGIVSPYETPLLDHLSDAMNEATGERSDSEVFTALVSVSQQDLSTSPISIADELDYQKQERLRELLRDLENQVINGGRHIPGIIPTLNTHVVQADGGELTESLLNQAIRQVWESQTGPMDTIVVGGFQKRRINSFIVSGREVRDENAPFRSFVSVYESDFGVFRVILSRWVPRDCVLLLDSSKFGVSPVPGRSFHYMPASEREGHITGEYAMNLPQENAHGLIKGLGMN